MQLVPPKNYEDIIRPQDFGAVGDGQADDTAAIQSAIEAAADGVGVVFIPAGTYLVSSPLRGFPLTTYAYKRPNVLTQGAGSFTILKFIGTSGYLFELEREGSVLPVGNTFQNFHVQCSGITDPDAGGAFLLNGAAGTKLIGISADYMNNATFVHLMAEAGQSIGNSVLNCSIQGTKGVKRGFWLQDNSFLNVTDGYLMGDQVVRNEQSYFRSTNTYYVGNTNYPENNANFIYDTGWSIYVGGTIEGGGHNGNCYFGGSIHRLIGVSPTVVGIETEIGTVVEQIAGGRDISQSDVPDFLPDYWKYRPIITNSNGSVWSNISGSAVVSDPDTPGGHAVQMSNQNDRVRYVWDPGAGHYSILPRGRYKCTFWAKDTNQEDDDISVWVARWNGSTWATHGRICNFTATSEYRPYTVWLDQLSDDVSSMSRGHQITIYKKTANTNTISVSHAIMEYVGPDLLTTKPVALVASDKSDADGARKNGVEFWGYKSGGEFGCLAKIEASHDGSGDDYRGKLGIYTNRGATNYSGYSDLIEVLRLDSDGGIFPVNIKSGTTQGGAGAVAGELWHDTTDNTVKRGI